MPHQHPTSSSFWPRFKAGPRLRRWVLAFGPQMGRRKTADILRAATGAGLALMICAASLRELPHARDLGLYLVSGFGAMSVLLFVLPNSPLAQPWSVLVGMMVSPTVAITVLGLVPPPFADGLAVTLAITAMLALRALHPPAAGLALAVVLQYETGHPFGYDFVLVPILPMTLAMVCLALLWNRAFSIPYPAAATAAADPPAAPSRVSQPSRLSESDIEALLLTQNQSANLVAADLRDLVDAAARRSTELLLEHTTVRQIMTPSPAHVGPATPLREIAQRLVAQRIKSLPVISETGQFVGIVDQRAVMAHLAETLPRQDTPKPPQSSDAPLPVAADLAHADIPPVAPDLPVSALLGRLKDYRSHAIPVLEAGQLVGIVSRSDLVALLVTQVPVAQAQS